MFECLNCWLWTSFSLLPSVEKSGHSQKRWFNNIQATCLSSPIFDFEQQWILKIPAVKNGLLGFSISTTETYLKFPVSNKSCPYSELFWSVFSRIRIEYEEILRIFSYSVRMRENTDLNKF